MDDPTDEVFYQHQEAICHNELGEVLRATSPTEARRRYDMALTIQRRLASMRPMKPADFSTLPRARSSFY